MTWRARLGCTVFAIIISGFALYLMIIGATADCVSENPCVPNWQRDLLFFGSPIVAMLLVSSVGYRLGKRDF
jgi:hypothetical protein